MNTTTITAPAENADRELLTQAFLVALDSEGCSQATARLYQYGLQRLFGVLDGLGLGAVPLAQLTREHLEHALAELRRERLSPSTRQAVHRAMRAFWRQRRGRTNRASGGVGRSGRRNRVQRVRCLSLHSVRDVPYRSTPRPSQIHSTASSQPVGEQVF